jgi:hypothetical protein
MINGIKKRQEIPMMKGAIEDSDLDILASID